MISTDNWNDARKLAERTIDVSEGASRVKVARALALCLARSTETSDKIRAAELYAEVVDSEHGEPGDWGGLATILAELDRCDEAKGAIRDGIKRFPDRSRAFVEIGMRLVQACGNRDFRNWLLQQGARTSRMSDDRSSFEIGIEFESILRAISKQIYETPHAFLRENVQNAIDAVRIQARRDGKGVGDPEYTIEVDVNAERVSVCDRGIGMSRKDLQRFFWTMGSSGKRDDEAKAAGCVGMFGIGGFANFGVCDRLVVTSRDAGSTAGTATSLSAEEIARAGTRIPKVTIAESNEADPRGTLVVGELKNAPNVNELKAYLQDFVRYVPIDVRFNGQSISRSRFEALEEQQNLTQVGGTDCRWQKGDLVVLGSLWEDRGHTLVASVEELVWRGTETAMKGRLRFEAGPLDVFKRGFKLCATQVPTTIGVSGRLDCDLFRPTAGRDSLDSGTMDPGRTAGVAARGHGRRRGLGIAGSNRAAHPDFSVHQAARIDRKDDKRRSPVGRRHRVDARHNQAASE